MHVHSMETSPWDKYCFLLFFFLDFYYDCQLVQMNKFFDTILLCKYYIFEYFEMNFGSNQWLKGGLSDLMG